MPTTKPLEINQSIHNAYDFVLVTPSDVADLTVPLAAFYVGTGGDLTVVSESGNEVTFANIQSGQFLPIRAVRVKTTGTTASDILALY